MAPTTPAPTRLGDDELLVEVNRLARCERSATAELIAHLAELDARRLYLGAGFGSLFAYCIVVLRLSEHEAYNRIEAARAVRRFPVILDLLREGSVNLTTIRLLAPHFEPESHEELLAAASGKRRREVEELVARRFPSAPVPSSVRKLPDPKPGVAPPGPLAAAQSQAEASPLAGPALLPAPTSQPRRAAPSWPRWRQTSTGSRSRLAPRRARSCGRRRTC